MVPESVPSKVFGQSAQWFGFEDVILEIRYIMIGQARLEEKKSLNSK